MYGIYEDEVVSERFELPSFNLFSEQEELESFDNFLLEAKTSRKSSNSKSDSVILKKLYPLVEKSLSGSGGSKFKKVVGEFITVRHDELYANAPYTRIYFTADDADQLFKALSIPKSTVEEVIKQTYYYSIEPFNPRCAKDPFTVLALMVIRYYVLKKAKKEIELSCIYLAFSGSFYPSIHYGSFPTVQPCEYKHIMEYVVNNELSAKYDLKREGNVIGAIRSVNNTWLDSYQDLFKSCTDEEVVYLLQQMHNRLKSFMINIADCYYRVYNNKDVYLSYNSNSAEEEDFRIADNDSLKAERYVQAAMNYITTSTVNFKFCKSAADTNVSTDEIRGIIESIQSDPNNIKLINELITIIITEYLITSPVKEVNDLAFLKFAIVPKPNSKNPNIIRMKEILEEILSDNSIAYQRRKSRDATRNSYHSSILKYYAFVIMEANK